MIRQHWPLHLKGIFGAAVEVLVATKPADGPQAGYPPTLRIVEVILNVDTQHFADNKAGYCRCAPEPQYL